MPNNLTVSLYVWLCGNCDYPIAIEDGGFAPELTEYEIHPAIKAGEAQEHSIYCGSCGHEGAYKIYFDRREED